MPFFLLSYEAKLRNLTNLQPRGGCDDANYGYYFKLLCENCGEISQKETCVMLSETVRLPTRRRSWRTVNLVQSCKLCGRVGSVLMIPGQGKPLTCTMSLYRNPAQPAQLMVFKCDGLIPVDFSFGDGWKAQSRSGTTFDIDLSGGKFTGCDGQYPVAISDLQASFKVVHKSNKWNGWDKNRWGHPIYE